MKYARSLLSIGPLTALCFLAAGTASATIIVEHSSSTNPATEGFVGGFGSLVTNDLGLGINAWNIGGSWCCGADRYNFSAAQLAALSSSNWVLSVYFRDLSTDTSGSYGPNSYGSGVSIGFDGVRYDIELHTDGHGGQTLAADSFASGHTYDIAGLGTNYVSIQLDYDAATKTADYYVNGTEVISGYGGFGAYPFNGIDFGGGGLGGNFNLVELEMPSSAPSVPEPSSSALIALGGMAALTLGIRRLKTARAV